MVLEVLCEVLFLGVVGSLIVEGRIRLVLRLGGSVLFSDDVFLH